MLDLLERQWHTATIALAMTGGETQDWNEVAERFDEYLAGETRERTKEDEMRHLLGLSPARH